VTISRHTARHQLYYKNKKTVTRYYHLTSLVFP
jgi:hypothetical protein